MAEEKKTNFFKGVKAEFSKVIWPDKQTTIKSVSIVLTVVAILGVIIAALDAIYRFLIFDLLFKMF